jgi:tRNA A-37 threonylcarbamoyl transferase component Bud32
MAVLDVNPRYREALAGLGLVRTEDFLSLKGVIYSGHPDRHILRLTLGTGPGALAAFLKKEHRVPWRDRLASAWTGFGLISKSCREFALLSALEHAGFGCPEPLAAGEADGRAFLLVRAIEEAEDLRTFLQENVEKPHVVRAVARQLGAELARLHAGGFQHLDLYSKHLLVAFDYDTDWARFFFLDWQRGRRRSAAGRLRDLAALDGTLADNLAAGRDRLACLHAYLRRWAGPGDPLSLSRAACIVSRRSAALLRRRRIRELRQPPLPAGAQNLIWMDGEALCVTRQFLAANGGQLPTYLTRAEQLRIGQVQCSRVPAPAGGWATLVQRSASHPWRWLWSRLRGRRLVSPELEQAGILFLLQRYGLVTPALLAVGQRPARPWQLQSFLLIQQPANSVRLFHSAAELIDRQRLHREAGAVLRRMHEAGCYLAGCSDEEIGQLFQVQGERIVLGSMAGLRREHRPSVRLARRDLRRVLALLDWLRGRAEARYFLQGYEGRPHITASSAKKESLSIHPSSEVSL